MRILDLSAGNRAIWFDPDRDDVMFLDARAEVGPTIVCDTRALPHEVGDGYTLIVFDPPHENTGRNSRFAQKSYGHWPLPLIRDTIKQTAMEAHRVSAKDALMAFKWNDHAWKIHTVLDLLSPYWEPLFGHGVRRQQRGKSMTYWVMLRRREVSSPTSTERTT